MKKKKFLILVVILCVIVLIIYPSSYKSITRVDEISSIKTYITPKQNIHDEIVIDIEDSNTLDDIYKILNKHKYFRAGINTDVLKISFPQNADSLTLFIRSEDITIPKDLVVVDKYNFVTINSSMFIYKSYGDIYKELIEILENVD